MTLNGSGRFFVIVLYMVLHETKLNYIQKLAVYCLQFGSNFVFGPFQIQLMKRYGNLHLNVAVYGNLFVIVYCNVSQSEVLCCSVVQYDALRCSVIWCYAV